MKDLLSQITQGFYTDPEYMRLTGIVLLTDLASQESRLIEIQKEATG